MSDCTILARLGTGNLEVADANGEPASGSANTRERLAGADFFEREIVRQAGGLVDLVERVERRLELIEIAARHWNTPE